MLAAAAFTAPFAANAGSQALLVGIGEHDTRPPEGGLRSLLRDDAFGTPLGAFNATNVLVLVHSCNSGTTRSFPCTAATGVPKFIRNLAFSYYVGGNMQGNFEGLAANLPQQLMEAAKTTLRVGEQVLSLNVPSVFHLDVLHRFVP